MTKEEAIEFIAQSVKNDVDMAKVADAIKALKQEPIKNHLGVDCVSREQALDLLCKKCPVYNCISKCVSYKAIEKMPHLTPIRPKGHWIETAEEYYKAINEKGGGVNDNTPYFVDDIACSECLTKFCIAENEVERFDSCPNCGADMREVK